MPDDPKSNLEKRCQACRTLGIQKGADNESNLEDLLNGKLDPKKIRALIGEEIIGFTTSYNAEDISAQDLEKFIIEMFKHLSKNEESVIRLVYGLNAENSEYNVEEIAKMFNLPTTRVRQLETSAIKKLKHPSVSSKLKNYLEK